MASARAAYEARLEGRTASRRPVSVRGGVSRADFWDGDRWRVSTDLTFRPRPGYTVSVDYERNEVSLPAGDFNTKLVRLNGGWDISPWASLSGNVITFLAFGFARGRRFRRGVPAL